MALASMAAAGDAPLADINRRNARRLLPLLMLGYVLNTLDKSNIGFASLQMNGQLGFTPAAFGLGAGLFFITYTIFEIPSNLLLRRYGARLWLSRILVSWGLASMAMALTRDKGSFYALRLLLGLAEAGWYPGVIYFLTLWFPREVRARAITWFVPGGCRCRASSAARCPAPCSACRRSPGCKGGSGCSWSRGCRRC